jgi:hypothetical protein
MSVWASKESGIEKARQIDVGDVLSISDEEPSILLPEN